MILKKILKIRKDPEKNDHLSENLAMGVLMHHQKKIQKFKNTKKKSPEKNLSSGENLGTGTT